MLFDRKIEGVLNENRMLFDLHGLHGLHDLHDLHGLHDLHDLDDLRDLNDLHDLHVLFFMTSFHASSCLELLDLEVTVIVER